VEEEQKKEEEEEVWLEGCFGVAGCDRWGHFDQVWTLGVSLVLELPNINISGIDGLFSFIKYKNISHLSIQQFHTTDCLEQKPRPALLR